MNRYWAYIHSIDRQMHIKSESIDGFLGSDLQHALQDADTNPNILAICPIHLIENDLYNSILIFKQYFAGCGIVEISGVWFTSEEAQRLQLDTIKIEESMPNKEQRFALIDMK